MVDTWADEFRRNGLDVYVEEENLFKLGRDGIVLAGKPDIVAVRRDHALVVDCKTGARRAWHRVQVQIYMVALPWSHPRYRGLSVSGRVQYVDSADDIGSFEVSTEFRSQLRETVRSIGGNSPLPTRASVVECSRCDISGDDCSNRIEIEPVEVRTNHDLF
jgi:hypothetical protein